MLLGLGAMATRAGVPRGWLREEALAGRIPFLAAGERMLFRASAVEHLLLARASGEPAPTPDRAPAQEARHASR